MIRKTFIYLVAVIFINVNCQSQSPCRTKKMEAGKCVPILTCKPITELLTISTKPLSPFIIESVRQLHCGAFNGIHHVCCKLNHEMSEPIHETGNIHPRVTNTKFDLEQGKAMLEATECGMNFLVPDRIVIGNGDTAKLSEYPWMALLVYHKGLQKTLECDGSLIAAQYVLTAAHCIRVSNKKLVSVRLGEHDLNMDIDCNDSNEDIRDCAPPIQEIGIAEAIYHADFNRAKFTNDIGLIRLIDKAVFSFSVRPICLPISPELQRNVFGSMVIAGWGRDETGFRANLLQRADLMVKDKSFCQEIHRLIEITDQQLCAGGDRNIDTCKGDSGGPMFSYKQGQYIQYGIVSAGGARCGSEFPGIYVNVSSYIDWIASNISP